MPKRYQLVPTKDEWKRDLGLRMGIFGNKKSPLPALTRLGRLMDVYHEENGFAARSEIAFHMFLQTMFVVKNLEKPDKLGGTLTDQQKEAVKALYDFIGVSLAEYVQAKGKKDFKEKILFFFGRSVDEHGQLEDQGAVDNNALQYYRTSADRRQFKLSFRDGVASRLVVETGQMAEYDTAGWEDAIEKGGSLYVMDAKGRIFVSGQEGLQSLKHSSFLAGEATLAAGTIRFEHGRLRWISGKSGHYKPTVAQMVTALERLSGYGVQLDEVLVYRENYTGAYGAANPKDFEPCRAKDLLKLRVWPNDPVHPKAMLVE